MNENEQNNEVILADEAAIEENQELVEELGGDEELGNNEELNEEQPSLPPPEVVEIVNNFGSLLPIQDEVNREIGKKLENQPSWREYILAYNCELYEALNAIGAWKWWKHNHIIEKDRVLDEVADCFAFILSAFLSLNPETRLQLIINFASRYIDFKNHFLEDYKDNLDQLVRDLTIFIGTASELQGDEHLTSLDSFALLLIITEVALKDEDVDWDDFIYYYKRKSKINIKRQKENYQLEGPPGPSFYNINLTFY